MECPKGLGRVCVTPGDPQGIFQLEIFGGKRTFFEVVVMGHNLEMTVPGPCGSLEGTCGLVLDHN